MAMGCAGNIIIWWRLCSARSFCRFLLIRYVPEQWYDDGGINEKLFRSRSVPHIFIMTAIIAFCEELLFRGVIQTHVGLLLRASFSVYCIFVIGENGFFLLLSSV